MRSTGLLDFHLKKFSRLYVLLSLVIKNLSQFAKKFSFSSFTSLFDGEMLDKSYNLKNFYNSVFIAFLSKSSCSNLEKYTDSHDKFYLNHSVVYFTRFFLYHNSNKSISQVNC